MAWCDLCKMAALYCRCKQIHLKPDVLDPLTEWQLALLIAPAYRQRGYREPDLPGRFRPPEYESVLKWERRSLQSSR